MSNSDLVRLGHPRSVMHVMSHLSHASRFTKGIRRELPSESGGGNYPETGETHGMGNNNNEMNPAQRPRPLLSSPHFSPLHHTYLAGRVILPYAPPTILPPLSLSIGRSRLLEERR